MCAQGSGRSSFCPEAVRHGAGPLLPPQNAPATLPGISLAPNVLHPSLRDATPTGGWRACSQEYDYVFKLVLIGGIQLNIGKPFADHFLPLSFRVLQTGQPERDLMPQLIEAAAKR